MILSFTGLRAGRRQAGAFALFALALLSLSCEKKVARLIAPPAKMSASLVSGFYDQAPRSQRALGLTNYSVRASSGDAENLTERKIVRNGSLELLVNDVAQSITKIGALVTGTGGYVEKSTQTNSGGHSADLTVRVPAARLDQVMTQVKALATTVDREGVAVHDVTREYIDLDARLRNAQAEEAQYLLILKRATSIKDTLDVTEKLSDVRGRIEQMQGEMKFLTSQIDMSSLEISLRAEPDAQAAGIHWRPLRPAKIAVGEMLFGMTDWADSVIAFFINLPLIGAWLISIVILILVAVRILRFLWRRFGPKTTWRLPWRRPARAEDKAVP